MADLVIRRPSLLHPSHERIVAPPWTSTGRSSEDSLRQGLVGAWSPAATGPTGYTLYDLSGKGNHGALTNMDLTPASGWAGANVNGKPVTALSFDGTNDFVNFGTASSINFGLMRSVAFWFLARNVAADQHIFTMWDLAAGVNQRTIIHSLQASSGKLYQGWSPDGTADGTNLFTPVLTNSTWYHVASVFRNGVRELWLNGNLVGSLSQASIYTGATTSRLTFGCVAGRASDTPTAFLNGQGEDACVYSRPLSPSEIRQLYQLGPGWLARPKQRASVLTVAPSSFTASGAVTTGAATASGSATHTTPTYTGTSAITTGAATCSGSATFTAPTFTAASSVTIAAATCSATGTFTKPVYSGTSVLTVGAATASGAATFVAPVYTASAAVAVGATVVNVAGSVVSPTFTGTAAVSVGAAVASGTASNNFVAGPYRVAARQVFVPGAVAFQVRTTGASAAQVF